MSETDDYVAITRLQHAYADVINRRAWAELAQLFRPDAVVRIDTVTREPFDLVGPDGVADFVGRSLEQFAFFEFVILNVHVELDGDAAQARLFMLEVRQDHAGRRSDAYGLYRDHYVRVDGGWWFGGRDYRSLARTATEGSSLDVVTPAAAIAAGDRPR